MNLKKHLEIFLIGFGLLTILMLYFNTPFSGRLIVASTMTLGLYYLMSGTLVLFNSQFIKPIRIIYFTGLWSILIGYTGLAFKLRFWNHGNTLLLMGISSGLVIMLMVLVYKKSLAKKEKDIIPQLNPIFKRILIYPAIFFMFYITPNIILYQNFGDKRDDKEYVRLFIDVVDHPGDSVKTAALDQYLKSKNDENDD
jgi:peptidoglycan/LPS O-acetylase OafA/YrhL